MPPLAFGVSCYDLVIGKPKNHKKKKKLSVLVRDLLKEIKHLNPSESPRKEKSYV